MHNRPIIFCTVVLLFLSQGFSYQQDESEACPKPSAPQPEGRLYPWFEADYTGSSQLPHSAHTTPEMYHHSSYHPPHGQHPVLHSSYPQPHGQPPTPKYVMPMRHAHVSVPGYHHQHHSSASAPQMLPPPFAAFEKKGGVTKILSLDAGEGLVTLQILQHLKLQTGQDLHELFDVVVASGESAFFAACLLKPHPSEHGKAAYTISELIKNYEKIASKMYKKAKFGIGGQSRELSESYPELVREYLGDTEMKDSHSVLVLPYYDLREKQNHVFQTPTHGSPSEGGRPLKMSDCVVAVSSRITQLDTEEDAFSLQPRTLSMGHLVEAPTSSPAPTRKKRSKSFSFSKFRRSSEASISSPVTSTASQSQTDELCPFVGTVENPALTGITAARTLFSDTNPLLVSIGSTATTVGSIHKSLRTGQLQHSLSQNIDECLKALLPKGSYFRFEIGIDQKKRRLNLKRFDSVMSVAAGLEMYAKDLSELSALLRTESTF